MTRGVEAVVKRTRPPACAGADARHRVEIGQGLVVRSQRARQLSAAAAIGVVIAGHHQHRRRGRASVEQRRERNDSASAYSEGPPGYAMSPVKRQIDAASMARHIGQGVEQRFGTMPAP